MKLDVYYIDFLLWVVKMKMLFSKPIIHMYMYHYWSTSNDGYWITHAE